MMNTLVKHPFTVNHRPIKIKNKCFGHLLSPLPKTSKSCVLLSLQYQHKNCRLKSQR
ncbi:hypothetical protein HMPREF1370_02572 [Enterococcus faecium P1123]|nr:hypothetical protein HMPREF1370_02572 [Enterococcus faecium P1123]